MIRSKLSFAFLASVLLAACGGAAAPAQSSAPAPASAKPATSAAASAPASASAKPAASGAASAAGKPAASGAASAAASTSGGAVKLSAFYSTVSATFGVMWVAKEAGIFAKNGIDMDVQLIQNPNGTQALMANQVQLGLSGAADLLGPDSSGADLQGFATFTTTYPYAFEVANSIKTPAELKGHKIGASQPGGSDYVALLAVLEKLNLDPTKDVTIPFVGGIPQRTAALLSGVVDGTLSSPPETLVIEPKGFHPLVDVTSLNLPSATSVLTAHKAWAQANHATMQKVVDSLMESIARVKSDRAFTEQVYTKYLKLEDKAALDATYDFFAQKITPTVPNITAAQFQDTATQLSKTNAAIKNVDINSVVDNSFVEDAVKRGVGK
ncbi:MAG TPA: ABC transporter substrate-binding protein [Chloroflexota bacterium]|nr:ABC transporter substrate-binding protein [Chloroflexota bacterium]